MDDYAGIAADVETKDVDEIKAYMAVFLKRFRETREKDVVIRKFAQKDFDQKNLETVLDYHKFKDFAILIQENFYLSRAQNLALFRKEHERLVAQNKISEEELARR